MLNIKTLIMPLLYGNELIDDNLWRLKVTSASDENVCRVKVFGVYDKPSRVKGIIHNTGFNMIFKLDGSGAIRFERITIPNTMTKNVRCATQAKEDLYQIFNHLRDL